MAKQTRGLHVFAGVVLCVVVLLTSAHPPQTEAFELGEDLGTHAHITREAIDELPPVRVGPSSLTFSTKAIDEIVSANEWVDLSTVFGISPLFAKWHFDDETLELSSERLIDLRESIVEELTADEPDGADAREYLGSALHTIQDFYAHSNWAELKVRGRAPTYTFGWQELSDPPVTRQFCERTGPGDLVGAGFTEITTGYFLVDPTLWAVRALLGKCAHGKGVLPGIAKDSTDHPLHTVAFDGAKAATQAFIQGLLKEPGIAGNERAIKALLGVGGSLVFVIDISGSMGDEISAVKTSVRRIITEIEEDEDAYPPEEYVLITFSDPVGIGEGFITADAASFLAYLDTLKLAGGGDCPEYAMSAILDAAEVSKLGASIFVFTDASAKDGALEPHVNRQVQAREQTLSYILSGSCSPIDAAYTRSAAASGGLVYVVSPRELDRSFDLIRTQVQPDAVPVLHATGTLSSTSQSFAVPVDATIAQLIFSLTVEQKQALAIRRPSGAPAVTGDPDVGWTEVGNGWVVTVDAPAPGEWGVTASGTGALSLAVSARSPIDFTRFAFVEPGGTRHEGLYPTAGQPAQGAAVAATGQLSGPAANAQFSLVSQQGARIKDISLSSVGPLGGIASFRGTVALPNQPFRVLVRGTDSVGNPFQRLFPTLFTPQPLQLAIRTPLSPRDFLPGQTTTISVTVRNSGPPDTFRLTVNDSLGAAYPVEPTALTLGTGASGVVEVDVALPELATDSSYRLTAVAASTSRADVANSAILNTALAAPFTVFLPQLASARETGSQLLYADDFRRISSVWHTADTPQARWSYQARQYELLIREGSRWSGVVPRLSIPANVAAEADMLRRGGSGMYGFIFGFASWNDFYLLLIDPDRQMYSVWQKRASFTSVIPWTHSPDILAGGATNRLRVERVAPGIVVYRLLINGRQQTAFRSMGAGRGMGFYAESPSGDEVTSVMRYDNFRLESLGVATAGEALDAELAAGMQPFETGSATIPAGE